MTGAFHRPVRMPANRFEAVQGGEDPAVLVRSAHETATALVARVRADPDPEVVERLVAFAEREGIDAVAELWSRAAPATLPGALWRLYLMREMIRHDAAGIALAFERGVARLASIDPVVAGAPNDALIASLNCWNHFSAWSPTSCPASTTRCCCSAARCPSRPMRATAAPSWPTTPTPRSRIGRRA